MSLPHRLALMTGASLLALSHPVFGQSTADLFDLGTIEIGVDPADPVPGYVATTAQTGTKTGTPILETPQSVSVVTGEQIEDQGATTLGDTLGFTAGLLAQPFGTDPRFDSPVIRGFDGSDAQYLNGLRILRDFGAPSFEIYSLERIEVLRGPSSVLYGSGIPGGIINQVQKRAQPLSFGEAGVGLGDPKASEAFVDLNTAVSDSFSARVTAVARDSEEDVEALTNERRYLGLATRWEIEPGTVLQFLGSYQEDSPITPAGVPFDLIGTVDDEDLREFYAGDPTDDDSDRRTRNFGFQLDQEIGAGWDLAMNYRHQSFDWTYTGFSVNNTVDDGDTITRTGINQFEDTATDNLDTRVTGQVVTGAVTHDLLFGLDLRRYDVTNRTEFLNADPISFSNPSYDGADLTDPFYVATNDQTLDQIGLYAQDEISAGAWRGTFSLRHDWSEQSGESFNNFGGTTPIDQETEATTGRIGVSYLIENGVAPYASYATSFDPEIGSDIDGDVLQPTEGEQWELGVKYQPTAFDAFFSAAIFDLRQTNLPSTVLENGITGIRQIGEVRSRGVEFEASADLSSGWNVRAAYTYLDAEQTDGDNAGNELPNAPRHNASLWANYTFAEGTALAALQLGGGVRFIGERYGDAGNLYRQDDVTLVDLQGSYGITEDVDLAVNVTNVTDEAYVANCGNFGCYYGDGRTVQARLTYRW